MYKNNRASTNEFVQKFSLPEFPCLMLKKEKKYKVI